MDVNSAAGPYEAKERQLFDHIDGKLQSSIYRGRFLARKYEMIAHSADIASITQLLSNLNKPQPKYHIAYRKQLGLTVHEKVHPYHV